MGANACCVSRESPDETPLDAAPQLGRPFVDENLLTMSPRGQSGAQDVMGGIDKSSAHNQSARRRQMGDCCISRESPDETPLDAAPQLGRPSVDENLLTMSPRGQSGAEDVTGDIDKSSARKPSAPRRQMGDLVKKVSTAMVTAEGRQQLREAEAEAEALAKEKALKAEAEAEALAKEKALKNYPSKPSKEAEEVDRPLTARRQMSDARKNHPSKPSKEAEEVDRPLTARRQMGDLVKKLSTTMVTAEGRQQLREAEAEAEALAKEEARKSSPSKPSKETEEVDRGAPPLEKISDNVWRIRGLYEHQVLKIGLRALDQDWSTDDLHSFPRKKDGGCLLFRERLMGELLKATLNLQSITQNDIATAQRDLPYLSLRQLLRLRVLHLDFRPSGAGCNTVTGVGGTHEAFLYKLDSMVFRQLGSRAAGLPPNSGAPLDAGEEHRLGRDAVLMVSAARALASPSSWCFWLSNQRRVFFDPMRFQSTEFFPETGVLEVTDLSKVDRQDPTGRLRWFDWRAQLITTESGLSPVPLTGGLLVSKPQDLASEPDSQSTPSPTKSTSSLVAGDSPASVMSPDLLRDALGSLRKTSDSEEWRRQKSY